jgi:hypothetical protein
VKRAVAAALLVAGCAEMLGRDDVTRRCERGS